MKKVRFESPIHVFDKIMDDRELECHSPRPFISKQTVNHRPDVSIGYPHLVPYNTDPVHRYENSNNSPYPLVRKTLVEESDSRCLPSNDLDLSMMDGSHEPRKSLFHSKQVFICHGQEMYQPSNLTAMPPNSPPKVLSSVENIKSLNKIANKVRNNNFFIRPHNLNEIDLQNVEPLQNQSGRLSLNKENIALSKQAEMRRLTQENIPSSKNVQLSQTQPVIPVECRCHHCIKLIQSVPYTLSQERDIFRNQIQCINHLSHTKHQCGVIQHNSCQCEKCTYVEPQPMIRHCRKEPVSPEGVDKRAWMLKKYEQYNVNQSMEIERQNNVKEKREPTVADLFKIIKLQNEQLQLLQEKVDKFISASNAKNNNGPMENYMNEPVARETVANEQHKISIGVMTSFEMVRTSTVINKEVVTQTNETGQIQCNKSQISIKEVVSKGQKGSLNFLDGITPLGKETCMQDGDNTESHVQQANVDGHMYQNDNINDDKTLNELSLYNVQVDNAITPLISPEQSLYLDVRDYSDSDSSSDDQSNVGWTYYNKVMTHVNGVLQDSDMPSSASAMYRNTQQHRTTQQQYVQMQIDRTNVSVTKRVTFGDDPLSIQRPHMNTASTDTSLKMNQLAAKYLKGAAPLPSYQMPVQKTAVPIDMSFATRNDMERHRILQGGNTYQQEMPRFLDITALKQQPKFL